MGPKCNHDWKGGEGDLKAMLWKQRLEGQVFKNTYIAETCLAQWIESQSAD